MKRRVKRGFWGGALGAAVLAVLAGVASAGDAGQAAGLTGSGSQLWHQDVGGIPGIAEEGDYFGVSLVNGDFDGDGVDDLAVGVSCEDVTDVQCAGAVNVLYGSGAGLADAGSQVWHQDIDGIPGVAETYDIFGQALASGDFDGDGFDDLAVGVPGEDITVVESAGVVNVIYGSALGLAAAGSQVWRQDSTGVHGTPEESDHFGSSLTSGDFDGDGFDDLAVGVPLEDVDGASSAGAVNVLYGSGSGLTEAGNQLWHQDSPGIPGVVETGDSFGSALASGDFDGDGFDDLAVGAPDEDVDGVERSGSVNVLYGSDGGLAATGSQIWHRDSPGIQDVAGDHDLFGQALTGGDFDGDGTDDLAVGVPAAGIGETDAAGAVNVIYGSGSGLTEAGNQLWHQDSPGIPGEPETDDWFGGALASGDFDGDGAEDLAVGVPTQGVDGLYGPGGVNVLYGSESGLTNAGTQLWHQNSPGVPGIAEEDDTLGASLASGDFDGDGFGDLAVGVPYEDVEAIGDAGAVNVLYGSPPAPTPTSTNTSTPTATTEAPADTPTSTATTEAPASTPTPTGTTEAPPNTSTPTATSEAPGDTPTPTVAPGGLVGDLDCSGGVNAIDAALVLQLAAGLVATLPCQENGDANSDAATNSIDAALILQFAAGIVNRLPP